jgi:hypothetical protein
MGSDGPNMQADLLAQLEQQLAAANARVQQLEQMAKVGEMFMSLFEKAADRPVLPSEALVVETALDWIGRAKRAESTLATMQARAERAQKVADALVEGRGGMNIYMHSRRTIMDGEVVTLATGFTKVHSWEPGGPFEVSASRGAVVVHRADIRRQEELDALRAALAVAFDIKRVLEPTWSGGHESKYPSEPTLVVQGPGKELARAASLLLLLS